MNFGFHCVDFFMIEEAVNNLVNHPIVEPAEKCSAYVDSLYLHFRKN